VAGYFPDYPDRPSRVSVFKKASLIRKAPFLKMDVLNAIQWPAMLVTVMAAWLVAAQRKFKPNWGFWVFLLSNVLWIVWGLHDGAFALVLLQICLAILNIREQSRTSHQAKASTDIGCSPFELLFEADE
jgi:hypothetical protein